SRRWSHIARTRPIPPRAISPRSSKRTAPGGRPALGSLIGRCRRSATYHGCPHAPRTRNLGRHASVVAMEQVRDHGAWGRVKSNAARMFAAFASRDASGARFQRHSMNLRSDTVSYRVDSMWDRFAHGEMMIAGTRFDGPQRSITGGGTWSKKPP